MMNDEKQLKRIEDFNLVITMKHFQQNVLYFEIILNFNIK